MSGKRFIVGFLIAFLFLSSAAFAAVLDITVGFDKIVYMPGENVTMSGTAMFSGGYPFTGSLDIFVNYPDGSSLISFGSAIAISGNYEYGPFPAGIAEGQYSVQVISPGYGVGYGVFDVEAERRYTLTTDNGVYSPGDNVTVDMLVETVAVDGTGTPAPGEIVKIKILRANGAVVYNEKLTTDANGMISFAYAIPSSSSYGSYSVVAGKGLAMAVFDVPSFDVSLDLKDSEGSSRYLYSTDDSLVIAVTVATETDKNVLPVTGANIKTYIKDSLGNTADIISSFTETSEGVYKSTEYELSNLTNGVYTVKTEVTKNNLTQTKYSEFKITRLRVDAIPFQETSKLHGFLRNQNASLGIIVIDLKTGKEVSGSDITNATISECRDKDWNPCLIDSGTFKTSDGEFSNVIDFITPNATGEYSLKVIVNTTTSGSGTGWTSIHISNVLAYAAVKDEFGGWRNDFGPGEKVMFELNAFGENGQDVTGNIISVSLAEVRDDDWNDVTANITDDIASVNMITISAPKTAGWYSVKIKVNTSDGVAYATEGFSVRRYHIWADMTDSSGMWQWKFGSEDDAYMHVMVTGLGGQQVDASKFSVQVDSVVSEMTGKRYETLNTSKLANDDFGRPVVMLSLNNLKLSSGFYRAEFSVIDMDGNKEYGSAWFKVSEFNVWVDTLDANGDWKWNFAPTDNITFEVNAQHFNGTDVANGAIVSVDAVMIMKEGPPIKVPADIYEVGSSTTSNGVSTVSVKPKSGKKFVQGQHMAIIKVNDTSTGKIEIQEAWFDIRVMDVWGYAQQWIVSDGENVSIVISAKNLDGTPIENATVSLKELRDTMSWTPVELPSYAPVNTSNTGSAIFQFSAEDLSDGEYEARLTVTSAALGASSEVFVWFRVSTYQISGWYADQSKWTYSPGESVALWVEVRYPNGTGAQGANVSIYQLANTENWPWKYVNASSSVATTDSQGRAKITFIAPSTSGFYNPMLNINGDLSKTPWELPGIQVKSASVSVDIYDNGTGYHEDVFGLDDVIRVDVGLSSTSNINGIKFYITELGDMPTSDDMVGSVSSDDIDTTTSYMITPSVAGLSAGEYILHTKVNVTTSDGYADVWEKRWLRIEELSFDVNWWTDTWSYTPGSDVVINMTSYPSENFNVSIVELRNVHAWSAVNISGVAVQNIAGSGTFEFTAPNETGEYQAELCIYTSGSCTEDSMRLWVWFSVETFHVWGWPDQPSYMSDDNVRLNILAIDPSTKMAIDPASYDVSFIELRDAMSWVDKSSLINSSAIVNDTDTFWEGLGTTLTFDAPSESGEYMFRAQLTKGSDIRYIDVWFKVSSFRVILDTVPPTKWTGDNKFGEDENITFNITVQPVVEGNATLGIRDDYNWETVKEYVVELVNGTAIVNASVSKTGYYMAIATVGTAEDQYWFQATAFSVKIKHDDSSTTHEVKMVDNVTIVFNVSDNDGSEYTGDINVTVKNIRNGWDWSIVASNVFDTTVTAVLGVEQFNFSHGLEVGDYELELEFEKDGKIVQDWFWFRVKDKEFWAWPDQPSYMPGENVTINVYIGNPDAILGINVSLETVRYSNTWEDVTDEIVSAQMWNLTDVNGKAQITFTTSPNRTGWFDVELIEDGSGVRSGMGYQVNSLDVNFERDEDKWMFAPVDNFTGILYVYGGDGSPAANRSVEVMLKSHDWTDVGVVNNGTTDASGQFAVNFSLAYPSNEYVALIKVDNGASEIHEWFSIQSMKLDWWAVGESSGRSDEIETTDNVIVTVEVRDMAGQPISGANVSLGDSEGADVRNLNGWASVDITGDEITDFAVTDSYGRAELKFRAENIPTGEYDARFNVSANVNGSISSVEAGAWFRIVAYLIDIDFVCPENAENCDPRRATAGGQLTARVDLSGIDNITGETKICLDYVRNMFSGYETDYSDTCGEYNASAESMEVTFTVPDEQSEYDAVFMIHIDDEFLGDRWEWFKVGGELDAWTWVQPHNTWAGQNTTIGLDVWDPSVWEPVSENCTDVTIVKIIDGKTWTVVDDNPVYYLNGVNKDMEGPNPSESYMVVFTPNETFEPGEYMAQIDAVCQGKEVKTEAWFRINSFEVSTMMKEFVKANDTVNFWFKVTHYNGTPIKNATVTLERMVDTWSWTTLVDYNTVFSTDHNGEVIGNFTAPDNPGDYNLELEVMDSNGTKQRVDRWFRIWQMDVSLGFTDEYGDSKLVFWEGEDVIVDVVVNDPMTGEAVSNAEIDLNIWLQEKGGEDNESESEEPQSMEFSDTTDSNGVMSILLDSSELKAGFYEADVHVYHNEMGDSKTRKTFTVKLFDIEISGLDSLYITPGEQLNITVNVSNSTDDALPNGTYVGIGIEQLGMKGSDENTNVVFADGTLSGGSVSFTLDVPVNATPGPGVLFAFAEFDNKINEDMQFIIMKGNSTINVTNVTGTLSPDELFDVNVTTDNLKLQMDPMAMHLRKIGSTISMFELMSSSPESGNEMFYESAIYFKNVNNTGEMHVMLQAQPKSGNYTAMLIFSERGSLMMGPEENTQFVFIDYEVIGDTEKPAVVDNLVAININTTGEVELEWSYSSDNVGVVKYKVYYNETDTNITDVSGWDKYIRLVSGSQNSTIVSKLTDDAQYCFAVTAIDSEGNENKTIVGGYCATPTAETTAPSVILGFPSNGFVINDSNKDGVFTEFNISASDGTPGPGVSGIDYYFLEISNSSDFNTSCTINYTYEKESLNLYLWDNIYMDLCGNGIYEWRATAYDHAGNSNTTSVWNFTLNITATKILFEDATFYPSDMPEDDVFLVNITNLGAAINLSVYDLYLLGNIEITEPLYGIGENETITYVVNGTSEPMFKEEDCSEGFEIGIVNRTDSNDYLAYRQMELNCV